MAHIHNPLHAFARVRIRYNDRRPGNQGLKEIDLYTIAGAKGRPNRIVQFVYERIGSIGSGNKWTVIVMDPYLNEVENAVLDAFQDQMTTGDTVVWIKYGYSASGGVESAESSTPWIPVTIFDYTSEVRQEGSIQITIVGRDKYYNDHFTSVNEFYDSGKVMTDGAGGTHVGPSSVFLQIAREYGWETMHGGKSMVEPTKRVIVPQYDGDKVYQRIGKSPQQVVSEFLVMDSQSALTNHYGYLFYPESDGVMHFHTIDYLRSRQTLPDRIYNLRSRGVAGQVHPPDDVIRFTPEFSGNKLAYMGLRDTYRQTDTTKNQPREVEAFNPVVLPRLDQGDWTVDSSHRVRLYSVAFDTPGEMLKYAYNRWMHRNTGAFSGTLEILGDWRLTLGMKVDVFVWVVDPPGSPSAGQENLYNSSGSYIIARVTDAINDGGYFSTVGLWKDARQVAPVAAAGVNEDNFSLTIPGSDLIIPGSPPPGI